MSNSAETVTKNAGFLLISQLLSWGISLGLAIIVPRYYGAEGAGQLHIAMSLWSLVGIVVGFGTDLIITREVARDKSRIGAFIGTGIGIQFVFHALGFLALFLYTQIVDYSPVTVYAIYLFGIAYWIMTITDAIDSAVYGLEKIGYLSTVSIVLYLFEAAIILTFVFTGQPLLSVAIASILSAILDLIIMWWLLQRIHPTRVTFDFPLAKWLLRESYPIMLNRAARDIYVQLDVIIISWFVSETVVGWYSVADRLYGTMMFIPSVIGSAIFPTVSRLYADHPESISKITRRSFDLIMVLIIPIGFGMFVIATPFVTLIYGSDFTNAGPVLQILGFVVVFTALNTLLGQQLIAMGKQMALTRLSFVAVLVTIPVDLLLIPWTQETFGNGALGGALAYVITEAMIIGGSIRLLPKGTLSWPTLSLAARAILAGVAMIAVAWTVKDMFLLFPILAGILTYVPLMFVFRLVSDQDQQLILSLANKVWGRFRSRLRPAS